MTSSILILLLAANFAAAFPSAQVPPVPPLPGYQHSQGGLVPVPVSRGAGVRFCSLKKNIVLGRLGDL